MHRCFLFPVALSVQLVICLCSGVTAFPSAVRQGQVFASSTSPDSSISSSEDPSAGPTFGLQELRYGPRLLRLLRLDLLSSSLDSPEADSEEDDLLQRTEPDRRFQPRPPLQKKIGSFSLDRADGPPRLSIVNPLDVLRQKMLLESLRLKNENTQRIVDENAKVLERLGKRNIRDYVSQDRSVVRPNRQRLSQMLSSLASTV